MLMTTKYEVQLNLPCCDGCGACVEACPEAFAWNFDTEKPVLKEGAENIACLPQAANYCHKRCITVEEKS